MKNNRIEEYLTEYYRESVEKNAKIIKTWDYSYSLDDLDEEEVDLSDLTDVLRDKNGYFDLEKAKELNRHAELSHQILCNIHKSKSGYEALWKVWNVLAAVEDGITLNYQDGGCKGESKCSGCRMLEEIKTYITKACDLLEKFEMDGSHSDDE
tara:strand:+ start:589 stop:1047 length:459 start_codon:yes stop_codon:yes gene_type:complete